MSAGRDQARQHKPEASGWTGEPPENDRRAAGEPAGASAEDLILDRLSRQIGEVAQQLTQLQRARFRPMPEPEKSAFSFGAASSGSKDRSSPRLSRKSRPALPDALFIRQIIRQRQMRARFFDGDLFADPAWDILLDLTAARLEHRRVSVTSLCIASGATPTTALRWIDRMIDKGLLERTDDEIDRRRAFIALTDEALNAMAGYFAEVGG